MDLKGEIRNKSGLGVGVKKETLNKHLVNKIFVKQNHKQ